MLGWTRVRGVVGKAEFWGVRRRGRTTTAKTASRRRYGYLSRSSIPLGRQRLLGSQDSTVDSSILVPFSSRSARFSSTATIESNDTPFLLADIGEGIHEVELLKWYVQPGDVLQQFDNVCQVQSDKATVDISSRYDGVVTELAGQVGDMIHVGTPLLYLQTEDDANEGCIRSSAGSPVTMTATQEQSSHFPSSGPEERIEASQLPQPEEMPPQLAREQDLVASAPGARSQDTKVQTSPAVRRLCREYGVDPSSIPVTGPQGRLLKADVLAHLQTHPSLDTGSTVSTTPEDASTEIPPMPAVTHTHDEIVTLKGYTRVMAQTMAQSLQIPHMTLSEEIDVTRLFEARKKLRDSTTTNISMLAFLIKACSLALHQYPIVNGAAHSETEIRMQTNHHMGVAMDTPRGLAVPVIPNVQDMSLVEIQEQLDALKANQDGLTLDEAPTFTLSNIGALRAGLALQPVLVGPQLAMGAIGRLQRLPRFASEDSAEVVEARILPVSWAADHRYLDGATLARFHLAVQKYLQDPLEMMIHMK